VSFRHAEFAADAETFLVEFGWTSAFHE